MKLIGVMSLEDDKKLVYELFETHGVQIFSEMDIKGHTLSTIEKYGWWPTDRSAPVYSVLCFAVVPALQATEIMTELENRVDQGAASHPIRAFQVDVERMI